MCHHYNTSGSLVETTVFVTTVTVLFAFLKLVDTTLFSLYLLDPFFKGIKKMDLFIFK